MNPGIAVIFLAGHGLGLAAPPEGDAWRLGHRDAIATALRNNLQVPIARETKAEAGARALEEEGAFDPGLEIQALGERNLSFLAQPQASGPVLLQDTTTRTFSFSGKLSQDLPWGASWELSYLPVYTSAYTWTHGTPGQALAPFGTTTPFPYSGQLGAGYTHHLLRGAGRQAATSRREAARKEAEAADPVFRLAAIDLAATVEHQYWELVFAEKHLAHKRTSQELARKLLQENRLRVQLGTLAAIEVTFAESQVAQAEQDIIASEAEVHNARAVLMRSVHPGGGAPSRLELTDDLIQDHPAMEEAEAIRMALDRRLELKAGRAGMEAARIRVRGAEDQLRPRLDLSLSFSANTGNHGQPGSMHRELAELKNPGYGVGLTFAVPVFNRAAKGRHARAHAALRKDELKLRDLELDVALDVERTLRNVTTARKGVDAAAKTSRFQEQNLSVERQKFSHGLSTSFTVLQVMTNLDKSRSEELRTRLAYAKAVTSLHKALGNLLEARNLSVH